MSRSESYTTENFELAPQIVRAHRILAENAAELEDDPTRPLFHFLPPSGWMNDPNGTIFHDGYYHVFYQHNPYDDTWHDLHWGHARSRDLVNWEHLPIALWPSAEHGEASCYSGSCFVNRDGVPMIFYTRVEPKPESGPRQQWAAVSDDQMIVWERHKDNPMVTVDRHGGPSVKGNWRDPFVFSTEGRTFLVIAAQLSENAGGDFTVLLYEAVDDALTRWQFRNILIRKPGYEMSFPECPNFIQLGEQWVLLTSPYKPVEYHVGTFNLSTYTFSPHSHGRLDAGVDYYATNVAHAPDGRTILFAWIRGFRKGRGWNGCLALPREIELGPEGRPITRPVRELETLRGTPVTADAREIRDDELLLSEDPALSCAEIECRFRLEEASTVELRLLRTNDGKSAVSVTYDGHFVDAYGTKIEHQSGEAGGEISLRVFIDRTVLEVFVDNGKKSATKVVYTNEDGTGISVRAHGGRASLTFLRAWPMQPARLSPQGGIAVKG